MKRVQFKIIVFVFCVFVSATNVKAESKPEEMKEMLRSLAEDCVKKTSATEAEVENLLDKKPAIGKEGKCLKHCLLTQFEVMEEGTGNFNDNAADKFITMMAGDDEEKLKKATEIYKTCSGNAKNENDVCERAEKYILCLAEEVEKSGLKFEE